MTEAELLLLENLPHLLPLLPDWRYLHSLPTTQVHLHSLIKGINGITCGTEPHAQHGKQMVLLIWERICSDRTIVEMRNAPGRVLLRLLAECLATASYTPLSFDVSTKSPQLRKFCDGLIQSFWVESGKCRISSLSPIVQWTLHNIDVLGDEMLRAMMEILVEVISHVTSVPTPQKSQVAQTELLHSLVTFTRETKASGVQMQWVLLFCLVVSSPTAPGLTPDLSLDLQQWLASFSLPHEPALQEKVLQCVVEWFSHSDSDVHNVCLSYMRRPISDTS
jgi:hypothetical protein